MGTLVKVIGWLLLLSWSLNSIAFTLNGVASYEHLRKEFYIAALYLKKTSSDASVILASNQSKRMVLKVTASRWSPRRWSAMWQNDIAINNPYSTDDELSHQLLIFSGFLQDPLIKGDEVIIEYVPTIGTRIFINNVKVIQSPISQLFNYLVNVWIGDLPPNGGFKNRILTVASDDAHLELLKNMESVTYDKSRSEIIQSWIQFTKDQEIARVKALKDKEKKERQAREKEEARELALAKKENKKLEDKALALAKKKSKERERLAAKKKKEAIAAKTYAAPKKKPKRKALPKKKKIASKKSDNTKKSKSEILAEKKYYQNLYQWELTREVRKAISYPAWAKKFGQSGEVVFNFNVNRQGKVSNLLGANEDVSKILVTEVKNNILAIVPLILPPDALTGNSWNFSFSYLFDPEISNQSYVKKPTKPKSLSGNGKISNAQYHKTLSQYLDKVSLTISSVIEYPLWSKDLKQKGLVEIEITIGADGFVKSSNDIKLSRHKRLNKAVREAIKKSQPLPPIPDQLKLNSATLTIKHTFE